MSLSKLSGTPLRCGHHKSQHYLVVTIGAKAETSVLDDLRLNPKGSVELGTSSEGIVVMTGPRSTTMG